MTRLYAQTSQGACPAFTSWRDALAAELPLLGELGSCRQDPEWHAEGDVGLHTGMVLDQLYADLERRPLSPERRLVAVLSALLHDIAKPLVTREQELKGRVRVVAPQHEARGRNLLVGPLLATGLPWRVVEAVADLVGAHHLPKGLVQKDAPEHRWRQMARAADPELLYRLELADMAGRTCPDRAEQIECMELFGMNCELLGLTDWERRWWSILGPELSGLPAFRRDLAWAEALRGAEEGRWNSPEAAFWLAGVRSERQPELLMICGPSGSGKSTLYERRFAGGEHAHARVSMDLLREELTGDLSDQTLNGRVRQEAREQLKSQLRAGRRVVWDATALQADLRRPILQLGLDYGALVTIIALVDRPSAIRRRNRGREHAIPEGVLERQLSSYELPLRQEAHRVLFMGPEGLLAAHGCAGGLPYGLELPAQAPLDHVLAPAQVQRRQQVL